MTNKINFHEIDKNGNHVMRLVGGDQEHRIDLMAASEDMYEALKDTVDWLALMEANIPLHGHLLGNITKALAKAKGK